MNEQPFQVKVGEDLIYGIWHQPRLKNNTSIIFLHGWAGHRPGPHDMLVKLARHLTLVGYDCFRFDFRGKGYSQGDSKLTDNHSMLDDLDAVIQLVNTSLNYPKIVLIGICSGAKLAFYYAKNGSQSIAHVIDLSSPMLRPNEAGSALAINQIESIGKDIVNKFFGMKSWKQLINGEIHLSAVWRNLSAPVIYFFSTKISNFRTKKIVRQNSKSEKKNFSEFKGRMLLVHGEKDPETKLSLEQIHNMLNRYNISYDTHIVKNANHSFYSLIWKKEIIEIIENWLDKNINVST